MELTIQKKAFQRALTLTHAVADRKSSMPILSNILISTDGPGLIRFAATDLYLAISASAEAKVSKGGTVAVSARTLFDIAKSLPEGELTFTVGPNHAAEIRCGKVRFKVPGMPGEDFPALPSPGETKFVDVEADTLTELITRTRYSMSSDDTRPHLAGTLFEGDGKMLRMVTTDGHRLSKAERKVEGGLYNFTMLVPQKGVNELLRLAEDARSARPKGDETPSVLGVGQAGGNAFFRREGMQLSVKLADEQFPPYARVIPQKQDKRVVIARVQFHEALKRINIVASEKSGGVRLTLDPGKLKITSENPDVGEGSEELDVDYAGAPLVVGFNAKYLLDVLGALPDDEVALELSGELDPGVVKGAQHENFVGVIMPMRI
jgi:DNA polymerase-3 subunit beta